MSQKAEKYARNMERRVGKLEQAVEAINAEQTSQGVRIASIEDDLAVYQAAVSARELKKAAAEVKAAKERRDARRAERERKARRRNKVLGTILVALIVAVIAVVTARACSVEQKQAAESAVTVSILPSVFQTPTPKAAEEYAEDPQENEKIEAALLANGYLSTAIPLDYDLQGIMRAACEEFGCPYPLALAVAQTESNFNINALGSAGEVGIMQLLPGPSGSYHKELEDATGRDPNTPAGNIACGVYLLGKYMAKYNDPAKAAMAYNMGESGARSAWAAGITSTSYSEAVLEALEAWECTVNAWGGV